MTHTIVHSMGFCTNPPPFIGCQICWKTLILCVHIQNTLWWWISTLHVIVFTLASCLFIALARVTNVCVASTCHIVVILFSRVPIANSYMHQSTWIDKDVHKYLLHYLVHIWSTFFSKHDRLLFILKRSFSSCAFWCHGLNLKCW